MKIASLSLMFLLFCMTMACDSAIDTTELQAQIETILEEEGEKAYIEAIFKSHPRREIREDFHGLIGSSVVLLGRADDSPRKVASVYQERDADGNLILRLVLANAFFQGDVKRHWSTLTHEWVHITGILDGVDYVFPLGEQLTEEDIRTHFEGEARAYIAECHFGKDIGMTDQHPACLTFFGRGEEAFRRELANVLEQNFESDADLVRFIPILHDQAKQ